MYKRMKTRKQMKKLGRLSLKRHYLIFVAACLIAAFLGSEFMGSLSISEAQDMEQMAQTENQQNEDGTFMVKTSLDRVSWEDVLLIIAEDDTQAGREMTREVRENAIRDAENGNPMFGRTRGVLSGIVNQLSSGSIIVTMVAAIASITGSENLGILILIVLGALGAFAFWFLVVNVFPVVIRRVFLEGMIYERVTPSDLFFF